MIVNAYDASNNLIAIQPYNYFIHNTVNISRVGNRFYPPDPNFASPNGSREGTVDFNFNGQYVSRVVFQFYDTEFTGSYSISKITAEACESGCVQPGSTVIGGTPTKVGITIQEKNDKWPESVPNGFIALESKTKGFVITRVANSGVVVEAKEGMLIYDIAAKCVKLYNGTIWNCLAKSCNE